MVRSLVVTSRRRTQLKAGITNLNKLVSYRKYNTVKKGAKINTNNKVTRNAPNPIIVMTMHLVHIPLHATQRVFLEVSLI